MYSVAAGQARNGTAGSPSTEIPAAGGETTPAGLARRVPGAQRPDAAFGARPAAPAPAAQPAPESPRTSPEDVYSFLSSFQSGVARGRADAHTEQDTETMEDGR
jgi:hypothetical protein